MTQESYRNLAAGLGALLAVLVLATAVVLSSGSPVSSGSPSTSPSPSATSSTTPSPSPSASAGPGESPTPSPTPPPTPTPSPTPAPTPPATPSPTEVPPTEPPPPTERPTEPPPPTPPPTPTPTLGPTAELTEIRFVRLGLDGPTEEPVPRYFLFRSDGPGEVTATVSDVTAGQVELCLWVGDREDVRRQECREMPEGSLTAMTNRTAQTNWAVSLLGAEAGVTPSADLTISFRAVSPTVTAEMLRFQGTAAPDHNGFQAVIRPRTPGTLALDASWTGGSFPYRVRLEPPGGAPPDERTGSGTNVTYFTPTTGDRYALLLENQQDVVEVESFVRAIIAWP